jgi:hypothetical protein
VTRYSDAALLEGEYAHLAAEMRAGKRAAPKQKDWDKAACDNRAEEAAQEVAKHIFAVQQSLDPEKEQLDVLIFSAAGQMKVIAIHPGDGDMLRVDGILTADGKPASLVLHASALVLTFVPAPLPGNGEARDSGLQIGFVIFDELQDRQKARYTKGTRKPKKVDLTKPFGLPPVRKSAGIAKKAKSR